MRRTKLTCSKKKKGASDTGVAHGSGKTSWRKGFLNQVRQRGGMEWRIFSNREEKKESDLLGALKAFSNG